MRCHPFVTLLSWLACVPLTRAVDTAWNVTSGDWATGGNWTAGTPVVGDGGNHYIENNGTAMISGGIEGAGNLWIGNCCGPTANGAGTLLQTGGTLGVQVAVHVGNDGRNGVYELSNATLARNAGQAGALNIMRGGGGAATGTFSVTNGTVNMGKLSMAVDNDGNQAWLHVTNSSVNLHNNLNGTNGHDLAFASNSQATIRMQSGTLNLVGAGGEGALNTGAGAGSRTWIEHSGGAFTVGGWADVSRNATSAATFNVSGGTLTFNQNLHLGLNGAGHLMVTGGTVHHLGGRFDVAEGRDAGHQSTGWVDVSGSGVLNTAPSGGGEDWFIGKGDGAVGTVRVHSGGVVNKSGANWAFVGTNSGSRGYVSVEDGGTLNHSTGRFIVGNNSGAAGTVSISGGTFHHSSGDLIQFGNNSGSAGTLNLSGGHLITSGDARVGENGAATVNQSGGTWTVHNWIALSEGSSSTSVYNLDGGFLRHTGDGGNLGLGIRAAAQFNQSGGTVHFGTVRLGLSPENQVFTATVRQTGGRFEAASLTIGENSAEARYDLHGGSLHANLITLGAGDRLAWGDGTLAVFSRAEEGTIDRTLNPLALSGPVVQEGRVLQVNGDLATGDGALQGSTLRLDAYEISGTVRHDQLRLTGSLDLDAGEDRLEFNLDPLLLVPADPAEADWGTLILAEAAALSGVFSGVDGVLGGGIGFAPAAGSGGTDTGVVPEALPLNTWYVEYRTAGPNAGDVLFHYHIQNIPEPASATLLLLGALILRRARRASGP
jgi:hypothetical protein